MYSYGRPKWLLSSVALLNFVFVQFLIFRESILYKEGMTISSEVGQAARCERLAVKLGE